MADDKVLEPRLLTLKDVAVVLNVGESQVKALVRTGRLPAVRIGGRGTWRVDRRRLDAYIQQLHEETARWIEANPSADQAQLRLVRSRPLPDQAAFMTARQAAEALGMTRQNVQHLIKVGKLRASKFDRRWLISADDVSSYRPRRSAVM